MLKDEDMFPVAIHDHHSESCRKLCESHADCVSLNEIHGGNGSHMGNNGAMACKDFFPIKSKRMETGRWGAGDWPDQINLTLTVEVAKWAQNADREQLLYGL